MKKTSRKLDPEECNRFMADESYVGVSRFFLMCS